MRGTVAKATWRRVFVALLDIEDYPQYLVDVDDSADVGKSDEDDA